jgi:pimeloyl-ACP methyl ester carboxylesterase
MLLLSALVLASTARAEPDVRITRGTVFVPEGRDGRPGHPIALAYLRLHGTAPATASPIVYLAGGPGGSGIADMTAPRFATYRRWLAFADIVALDQRGTGASMPSLGCPAGFGARRGAADTRASFLAAYRQVARRCAAYWHRQGVLLAAYTTEASADDVADLARQLGYARIRLFGASYGSHLGLSVIRRHPALVERAVLGAIEGPDQTIKLPAAADAQLNRIGAAIREDAATARVLPDFAGFVRDLIRRADAEPLAVGVDRITGFDLRLLLGGMIGRRSEIEQLPALFGPAAHGDYRPLAREVAQGVRQADVSAMGAVMDCASWASPARLSTIRQQAPGSLLGTALDFPLPDWCDAWPARPLPAAFRMPVVAAVPTLFLAGDLDGQTPPASAAAARQGFRNGRLFLVHRAGHDSSLFLSSPALFDAITAFMAGSDTPDREFDAPPLHFAPVRPETRP